MRTPLSDFGVRCDPVVIVGYRQALAGARHVAGDISVGAGCYASSPSSDSSIASAGPGELCVDRRGYLERRSARVDLTTVDQVADFPGLADRQLAAAVLLTGFGSRTGSEQRQAGHPRPAPSRAAAPGLSLRKPCVLTDGAMW